MATNKKEKTMEEIYGAQRAKYITGLGQAMDMEAQREREAAAQQRTQLTLSDLEAYYRGLLEDSLYNRNSVYTNPDMTPEERAQIEQAGADDFNRFLNAYLLILQEQGIDVNDPSAYLDATQREINGLEQQIQALESGTRNAEQQAQYESLLQQRQQAQERYSKAEGIWQYTDAARAKGWTPDTVGESGVDFGAINQSAKDRQYMQDRMAEGFGSGGDASSLWLPEEKPEPVYGYGGGVVGADEEGKGGVYVAPGKYTAAEFEEASVNPYARVGEDGLTGGQRLIAAAAARSQRQAAQRLASLIGQANAQASARNNTAGWTSEEYPDIDTRVANDNTAGVTVTDAGRAYLAQLAASQAQEGALTGQQQAQAEAWRATLKARLMEQYGAGTDTGSTAAASGAADTGRGAGEAAASDGQDIAGYVDSLGYEELEEIFRPSLFGQHHSGLGANAAVGETGLTAGQTSQAQNDAYLAMLDAMARGAANTGGYANTAAFQAANSVYDAYQDMLPQKNLTAAYSKYLSDSGNRAGTPAYRWLNRNQNGGFGTTAPKETSAPVTKPATQTQVTVGTIPKVSGGTPVTGTPVRQQQSGDIGTILSQLLGGGRTSGQTTPGFRGSGQLRRPSVMQAQNNIAQYLNSLLRR